MWEILNETNRTSQMTNQEKLWSLRNWNKRKLIIRKNTKSIMKLLLRIQKIYKTSTRKRNESTSAKIFSIPSLLCSGQGYTTSNKSKVKNIMTSSFFTGCSHDLDVCASLTQISQIISTIFIMNGMNTNIFSIKDWVWH